MNVGNLGVSVFSMILGIHGQVMTLVKAGCSEAEIAKELDIEETKVHKIIEQHKKLDKKLKQKEKLLNISEWTEA